MTTFKGHIDYVSSVSFSLDEQTIASASNDGTIILWNLSLDDLLSRGCEYLKDYLTIRSGWRQEICPF
ncbi:WD40 repeat domain-containing protein [Dulcicalothrix desertica]|uniref:WD40 repeat domain-containing protein n=1 Tax=Dulcicalothrix desertica TaxID=32056 RepID=UPI000F8E8FAB|nr:hypothetical protein [Dulcicalothrix desertica]